MGFVHYAFNAGAKAIDNRLEVPVSMYPSFPIGHQVPVTYLPLDPHTVRIGDVSSATITSSIIVAIVFLLIGAAAFGLPLIGISSLLAPSTRPSA